MTCSTVKEKCNKSVKMRVSVLVLGLLSVALIHIAEPRKFSVEDRFSNCYYNAQTLVFLAGYL